MSIETFDSERLESIRFDKNVKLSSLQGGFESSISIDSEAFISAPEGVDNNFNMWLGMEDGYTLTRELTVYMDTVSDMYKGVTLSTGDTSLGLEEIHGWKKNPDYYEQNVKQQSGYAAEVISTAKENMIAKESGSEVFTYRADDRPDLYKKNDPYVDKIRVDGKGNIIERIQTKFVGKDGKSCLSKLESKEFDKYFNDGKVDKIEIPKDYYPDVKNEIVLKKASYEQQLKKTTELGKTDEITKLRSKIERLDKIDEMIEQSTVTSSEAINAVKHPKRYIARLMTEDAFKAGNKAGVESAALAGTITVAVTTVDNVYKVIDGEMTTAEAFVDVAKDTAIASGAAYGTTFVSTAVSKVMNDSSHQLINSLGKAGAPAVVISFGVQSYDSITDFATGVIDGKQLAYDLGQNAVEIGGSIAGTAIAGATVGSIVPGAGTVVGFSAGLVGGMVGTAIASEAYSTAVQFGAEHADKLAGKAKEMAEKTVNLAKEVVPDKVESITSSLNDFATANNLPFRV